MYVSKFDAPGIGARTPLWLLLAPGLWAAILVIFALLQPWVTMTQALRDVQTVVFHPENRHLIPLAGFLSNFGIMAWVTSFAVTGFAAVLTTLPRFRRMFAALSVLSLILALDDFFIIHERVGPINLGIPEKLFFLTYGVSTCIIIAKYRREFRRMAGWLLLISVTLFVLSIAVDVFHILDGEAHTVFEDVPKLFGVAYWCAFCCRVSWLGLHTERMVGRHQSL